MRQSVFLFLVVATITSYISLANASNRDITVRYLKGAQTSTEENELLNADDEERGGWDGLATKMKSGQLDDLAAKVKTDQVDDVVAAAGGNKLQQALEKVKSQNALKDAEKAAGAATTGKNNWKTALEKLKANNFKDIDDIKAPTVNQNRWQSAVTNIKAGKLNNVDTTNNKWQSAVIKLKAEGFLKNVDEAQIAKVTEGVAKEIAKAPEKSSKFKKFLEITFGAVLTALIVIGFDTMIS